MSQTDSSEKEGLDVHKPNDYGTGDDTTVVAKEMEKSTENGIDPIEESDVANPAWMTKYCNWMLKYPWIKKNFVTKKSKKGRVQWDNRAQYVLTLVGYAVGIGNVWRFSYLVAKNGGAVFLIPYLIMLFVIGIPLFYLESALGQMTQKGPMRAWYKICPNLWGIGLTSVIVTIYISIYYNVIISWILFYLVNSFSNPLPWAKCENYTVTTNITTNLDYLDMFQGSSNYASLYSCINDSTRYYWYTGALGASTDIAIAGTFNWKIYICLFFAWLVVYLCIFRGIASSGKVVYFTATFPYVVLLILFFRGVTLTGAGDGLKYLFIPDDINKLFEPQVWLEASTQIFFSLGLSLGVIIALASFSDPKHNVVVDSVAVCLINSATSIFASIVVFSVVGFKAHQLDTSPKLVSQGPGLAFVVFTEAITLMPISPLWAVLFFIMLFLLGLDSQFATLEGIIATVYDDSKTLQRLRKEIVVGLVCIVFFIISLPFVLGNGLYLFQLFDQFAGTLPLLFCGFFEVVCVAWVYGSKRYLSEVTHKVNCHLATFWWIMWSIVDPIVMVIIFFGSVISQIISPLQYTAYSLVNETGSGIMVRAENSLPYPSWALFIGAVVVISSVAAIPGVLIVRLIALPEAREQASQYIQEVIAWGQAGRVSIRRFFYVRFHSYSPQVDDNGAPGSDVPYQAANGVGTELKKIDHLEEGSQEINH